MTNLAETMKKDVEAKAEAEKLKARLAKIETERKALREKLGMKTARKGKMYKVVALKTTDGMEVSVRSWNTDKAKSFDKLPPQLRATVEQLQEHAGTEGDMKALSELVTLQGCTQGEYKVMSYYRKQLIATGVIVEI